MKKITFMTTVLVLAWTSMPMAAGEDAYTFGQSLQELVRQQQARPNDNQDKESLGFLSAQRPQDKEQAKDEKAETWTMKRQN